MDLHRHVRSLNMTLSLHPFISNKMLYYICIIFKYTTLVSWIYCIHLDDFESKLGKLSNVANDYYRDRDR